jgi:1-aminocyclopropane-1-carboxylate deaminase/D-cysteine desulfhydrase-like pyridoxal-dependent ACC family enzyme
LPEYIDNLIVPCGSGITLAGIIVGCHIFNKKVKRFIGIQISGYDRTKEINEILKRFDIKPNYKFCINDTYKYSKKVNATVASTIELNKVYEAKAYEYFLKNKERIGIKETEKSLFWVVANNNEFMSN